MSNPVKIALYAVLVLVASISGYFAMTNFGKMMSRAGDRTSSLEQIEPVRAPHVEASPSAGENQATNAEPDTGVTSTNSSGTIEPIDTNHLVIPEEMATNELAATKSSDTNSNVQAEAGIGTQPEEVTTALSIRSGSSAGKKGGGRIGLWTGLFILSLIALGLLIASDVSHFLGNRTLRVLYNDEGEGQANPGYEKAEELWANGQHLEAIQLMREYLTKNPREQHVAIRIAEIYEKDLNNNLAAALEYEEVLKHKLQPDRWGWAAIHLCNLYFRLNQEQKGFALLRRIVKEHPNSAAAEKARKRLGQVDGGSSNEAFEASDTNETAERPQAPPPNPERPGSNLPPGFRPKK